MQLRGAPENAKLFFFQTPPDPVQALAGIEIDVVLGYGGAADVPAPLRQAILMLVARWFENRGDAADAGPDNPPAPVAALIAPFRRLRLG